MNQPFGTCFWPTRVMARTFWKLRWPSSLPQFGPSDFLGLGMPFRRGGGVVGWGGVGLGGLAAGVGWGSLFDFFWPLHWVESPLSLPKVQGPFCSEKAFRKEGQPGPLVTRRLGAKSPPRIQFPQSFGAKDTADNLHFCFV